MPTQPEGTRLFKRSSGALCFATAMTRLADARLLPPQRRVRAPPRRARGRVAARSRPAAGQRDAVRRLGRALALHVAGGGRRRPVRLVERRALDLARLERLEDVALAQVVEV